MVNVEESRISSKRKPLKGAVLFTVLCVMAVILTLMITTIGLSSIASKRAYSEYYDAQIAATGRSVINSVLESLEPKAGSNKALGKTIYDEVGKSGSYTVHLANGGELGQGLGRVEKIEFSKAGIDSTSDFFVSGTDYMIMKVTATITMGNKTTTYSEYVSDMVHIPGKNGGNGGLLSTSGASTSGTGMTVLGPFGGGFKECKKMSGELVLKNEGGYVGTQFFNSSIKVNTYKTFLYDTNSSTKSYDYDDLIKANYQGMTLLGDFKIENNAIPFISKTANTNNTEIPYIFLTGTYDATNSTYVSIGTLADNGGDKNAVSGYEGMSGGIGDIVKNTSGNRVNLYCGSFDFSTKMIDLKVAGDIYCYDNTKTSNLGGGLNTTPLLNWAQAQIADGNVKNANVISGNIYTKGNLKLLQCKVGVDGNVYVDGELNLEDIVKIKNMDQIPRIHNGKIYCRSVKPTDYTNEDGASNEYKDLVSKIEVTASSGFPADMELETILGITFTPSVSSGSEQLKAIEEGKYELNNSADFSKKIIQNPKEMNSKFYMADPNDSSKFVLRNSYNQSGVTNTASKYTGADIPSEITDQCVISGTISGKKVFITPKPKSENKELWITLDGVTLDQTEFIVKDTVKDAAGKDVEAGPVCFYIKDGTDLQLLTGSRIITQFYADNYFASMGSNNQLKNDINIKNGSMSYEYIPNVYLYGSNREGDVTDANRETIKFANYAMFTGYIIAPRAALEAYNMGQSGSKVTYDGVEYKVKNSNPCVGIVGSVIVGPIKEWQNDVVMLYVDNSDPTNSVPPHDYFGYTPLPGFTNY